MPIADIGFPAASDIPKLQALGLDPEAHDKTVILLHDGEIAAALLGNEQPFESQILSRATLCIHRVWRKDQSEPLTENFISQSVGFLADQGIELFAYRVAERDVQEIERFKAAGFKVIETLQTFEYQLPETTLDLPVGVEFARTADADECARIAAEVFHSDRFHTDPDIPNNAANELKKAWARNSVSGSADRVLITRSARGKITGFNACMLDEHTAVIDLIGVGAEYQGQGLGRLLARAAQTHYAGKAKRLIVGTQKDNFRSTALYQSLGFSLVASSLTLHLHRHDGQSDND